MTDREKIHDYLKTLSKYLARLEHEDADEVLKEIESHIFDALELKGETTSAEAVLDGLGSPRELAAAYVGHILEGTPPPEGFNAIQKVKRGVTKSLFYSTALFGYGWSAVLILLGISKFLLPHEIVIWEADHGSSFIIGQPAQMPEGSVEIIGMSLIPVALLLGLASIYLTRRLLGLLRKKL